MAKKQKKAKFTGPPSTVARKIYFLKQLEDWHGNVFMTCGQIAIQDEERADNARLAKKPKPFMLSIAEVTFYDWVKTDPSFAEASTLARIEGKLRDKDKIRGKLTEIAMIEGDTQALIYIDKAISEKIERFEIKHINPVGKWSDDELNAFLAQNGVKEGDE